MRIISGDLKGKKIKYLSSAITRPLRDFVKENIFNIITHSSFSNVSLKGSNILDLYSGIGSFGIECLSRGAKKTTFVDNDQKALKILEKNLEELSIKKKSSIYSLKISSFLENISKTQKFDIIFFDPPFALDAYIEELKLIKKLEIFNKDHLIIIHRENGNEEDLKNIMNIIQYKNYGKSKIIFGNYLT
jgi:16S rRNA (guanine966-N2)-methyltransferase